ncbi:hypothetical protein CWO92_09685 [Heyndrickxia camelliae]|uniref:Uncharacterized protein n=1 Tax=Heyndrickxia camelliae TaxID=1707093 RepID=A0A2N3LLN8_9BACI|nr:hypothetical protein CWO92_09685 [Heyndrickxia camelliae]
MRFGKLNDIVFLNEYAYKGDSLMTKESLFKSIVGEIMGEIIWNILTFIPRMLFHFIKHIV